MNQRGYGYETAVPVRETNGIAIAGFICSLAGLILTGGLLSPIGLILSLVGLGKPYGRGWAVAGVVIGLLGSCSILLVLILIPAAFLALLGIGVAFVALAEPEKLELTSDMVNIAIAAKLYEEDQGVLPASLDVLDIRSTMLVDPWGSPYEYFLTDKDPGFDLSSKGADGIAGNEDDIYLTRLGETWEAAGSVVTSADDDSGTVTFTLGDRAITLHGDDRGGRITIDAGDRIIEIEGDEHGSTFDVRPSEPDDDAESTGDETGDAGADETSETGDESGG